MLQNVFAFENYDAALKAQMIDAFHRHGIPIAVQDDSFGVALAAEEPLPMVCY